MYFQRLRNHVEVFCLLFSLIFFTHISESFPVPKPKNVTDLSEFVKILNTDNCLLPNAMKVSVKSTLMTGSDFLSTYLGVCKSPLDTNVAAATLCGEIFHTLKEILCSKDAETNLSVSFSNNVCDDFQSINNTVLKEDAVLSAVSNMFSCSILCEDKYANACQVLLWAYREKQRVKEHQISQDEVIDKKKEKVNQEQNKVQTEEVPENPKSVSSVKQLENALDLEHDHMDEDDDINQANQLISRTIEEKKEAVQKVTNEVKEHKNEEHEPNEIKNVEPNENSDKPNHKMNENSLTEANELAEVSIEKGENVKVPSGTEATNDTTESFKVNNAAVEISVTQEKNSTQPTVMAEDKTKFSEENGEKFQVSENKQHKEIASGATIDSLSTIQAVLRNKSDNPQKDITVHSESTQTTLKSNLKITKSPTVINPALPSINIVANNSLNIENTRSMGNLTKQGVPPTLSFFFNDNLSTLPTSSQNKETSSSDGSVPPDIEQETYGDFNTFEGKHDQEDDSEDYAQPPRENRPFEVKNQDSFNRAGETENLNDFLPQSGFDPKIAKFPQQEDSHFFFYFVCFVLLAMVVYMVAHNKKKIIALVVEGRNVRHHRSHGVKYKKLDNK